MRPLLFALALAVACASVTLGASAQRATKKVLVVSSNAAVPKFRQVEQAFASAFPGTLVRLDLGSETGADARLRTSLLAENPDGVFCVGSRACLAAAEATRRAPIVFTSAINAHRLAGADNVFGVASEMPAAYQLTTFRQFFPALRRIGLLYSERHNEETARGALAAGRDVGIEVLPRAVHRAGDAPDVLRDLLGRVDAIWVVPDPVVLANEATVRSLLEIAHRAKVPVLSYDEAFVELGAVLAMSSDQATIGTQAALLLEDIVTGRPVEQRVISPAGSQIVVNTRTLADYGIALGREALASVNRFVP